MKASEKIPKFETEENISEEPPVREDFSETAEDQRAKEEFDKSKFPHFDEREITKLIKFLDSRLEKKHSEKALELIWHLDQREFIKNLRDWWDARSAFLQKYLYYAFSVPIFRYLVTLGILELNDVTEENLQKIEERRNKGMKIAAFLLPKIFPELKAFEPLIAVCQRLSKDMDRFGRESREYLREKRRQEELKNRRKGYEIHRLKGSREKPNGVQREERKKIKKAA